MTSAYMLQKFIKENFSGDNDKVLEVLKKELGDNSNNSVDLWKTFFHEYAIRELCLSPKGRPTQASVIKKLKTNPPLSAPKKLKSVKQRLSEMLSTIEVKTAGYISNNDNFSVEEKEVGAILIKDGYEIKYIHDYINTGNTSTTIKNRIVSNRKNSMTFNDLMQEHWDYMHYVMNGGTKPETVSNSAIMNISPESIKNAIFKGIKDFNSK